jgi:hypothetical protein
MALSSLEAVRLEYNIAGQLHRSLTEHCSVPRHDRLPRTQTPTAVRAARPPRVYNNTTAQAASRKSYLNNGNLGHYFYIG